MMEGFLSKQQIAEFEAAFNLFDRDGDGCITIQDLAAAIKSLHENPSHDELLSMMEEAAAINGNATATAKITSADFLNLMATKIKEREAEENLKEAFRVFDMDRDGYLSPNELRRVMKTLGEKVTDEELEEMIKEADLDGDGLINYQEFVRMMSAAL